MAVLTWATAADVFTYTGTDVTDPQLAQAAAVLDVATGRTYDDVARIGSRDQYWLKLALCYQAAWMLGQLDYFNRLDRLTDGHSSTLTTFPEGAMVLGPVAKKALKRVSWLKSRSLHVRTPFQDGLGSLGMNPLSSAADGMYGWDAIGGG